MAKDRPPRRERPLPPPLPPETRTVGQLVAETIRFYGAHFWPSLALGIPPAALDATLPQLSRSHQIAVVMTAGPVLLTISFVGACALVSGGRPTKLSLLIGFVAGVAVFIPFPLLASLFILPAIAWLALVGLAVPAAVIEGRGLRAAFGRGLELARADYVHALGSLATLAITYFLTRLVLFFTLRTAGQSADRIAAFLADLVLSPMLFLGAALVYFDQEARAEVRARERESFRTRTSA